MKDFTGQVAIVTGSSSGVGAATARLLASLGCHVVINYSSKKNAAEAVAEECRQHGVEVLVSGTKSVARWWNRRMRNGGALTY